VSYELREAIRLAESAIHGSPWTGNLDKHEVGRAVRRLITVAESIERECERLKGEISAKTRKIR
jgi:hypothetical protein